MSSVREKDGGIHEQAETSATGKKKSVERTRNIFILLPAVDIRDLKRKDILPIEGRELRKGDAL